MNEFESRIASVDPAALRARALEVLQLNVGLRCNLRCTHSHQSSSPERTETLSDEVFEAATWTQLNYHKKPVGLLNAGGYYDHLLAFLNHAHTEGFIREEHSGLLCAAADPEALLTALEHVEIPELAKWIDKP